jgi:hypothetical protein
MTEDARLETKLPRNWAWFRRHAYGTGLLWVSYGTDRVQPLPLSYERSLPKADVFIINREHGVVYAG